ncbi:MAG TPA: permease prefix domain 1-containing protein [Armatimonadota bacterium]|nr:permease prefix domain 1-containing protein [Armatimonadota bacterium]
MNEQFSQIIDAASSGLRDDPELRLDVRAELGTHLECTAHALQDEGMSKQESIDEAIAQFGSPVELAGELLEANKARMKLRALVRLAVRGLLIPLAVLVALWVGYGGLVRLQQIPIVFGNIIKDFNLAMPSLTTHFLDLGQHPLPALPGQDSQTYQRERLFPTFRADDYPRLLALYHSHPGDKAVYAYMFASLGSPRSDRDAHIGESLDPDNALYNYLLAVKYVMAGCETRIVHGQVIYTMTNRASLDRGMRELQKGLTKPYVSLYTQEIMRRRLAQLPVPSTLTDYYGRTLIVDAEFYPIFSNIRELARFIPWYTRLLINEGHIKEAKVFLDSWKCIPRQLIRRPTDLLHLLVADTIAKKFGEQTAQIYDEIGEHQAAQQTRDEVRQFHAPIATWKTQPSVETQMIGSHGNMLLHTISSLQIGLASGGSYIDNDALLLPQRTIGYDLFEEIVLNVFLLIVAACILVLALEQFLIFLNMRHAAVAPLLLLPGWRDTMRIALLSVVLPMALYACYTALPYSGRAYSVESIFPRFLVEMVLLGVVLLGLPGYLATRFIRKRCRSLRIPVLDTKTSWRESRQSKYRLYRGSLVRSLIPIYALMLLLIAGIGKGYLARQEHQAYQQDRIFFIHPGQTMPLQEADVADSIRQQMLNVEKKW